MGQDDFPAESEENLVFLKGEYKMKKKVLSLLVAVTLCMVLIAMPFTVSAEGNVSGTIGGQTCRGRTWYSAAPSDGLATTSFSTYANYIKAHVLFRYGYGSSINQLSALSDDSHSTYVQAVCDPSGYPVGLGTKGTHRVEYNGPDGNRYAWENISRDGEYIS